MDIISVKTNEGKQFLRIIDISVPPDNPLRKLFNRSTVKVLYKCMPDMGSIVSSHNTKLLQRDPNQQQVQGCNCQGGPGTCPLTPAECQKDKVIYVASVESVDGVEHLRKGGINMNRILGTLPASITQD